MSIVGDGSTLAIKFWGATNDATASDLTDVSGLGPGSMRSWQHAPLQDGQAAHDPTKPRLAPCRNCAPASSPSQAAGWPVRQLLDPIPVAPTAPTSRRQTGRRCRTAPPGALLCYKGPAALAAAPLGLGQMLIHPCPRPCSPPGYYCDGGVVKTACPADTANPFLGATDDTYCTGCTHSETSGGTGYTSGAGSAYCTIPYVSIECGGCAQNCLVLAPAGGRRPWGLCGICHCAPDSLRHLHC